jgi:hypothetical protein
VRGHLGDKLVISGHQVGEPKRVGQIMEVRGEDGGPPYRVKWDDDGHTTLLFPGPDCSIEPIGDHPAAATVEGSR